MPPIKIMADSGLLCWSTLLLGMKKGWACRNDAIDFAVELLVKGNNEEDVALIAAGDCLQDDEFFNLIKNRTTPTNRAVAIEKWRLAFLLSISGSDDDEQTKLDRLQEVYANFDYPEDMVACSIYSQHKIDPLVAMAQIIEKLKFLKCN